MLQKLFNKIFLITVIGTAVVFMVMYMDFPPEFMSGSAIKGVEKATKYRITDTTSVELEGEEFQILLQNDEFQALMMDENFIKLLNSPEFTDIASSSYLDAAKLGEFRELFSNVNFMKLYKNQTLSNLANSPKFMELAKSAK